MFNVSSYERALRAAIHRPGPSRGADRMRLVLDIIKTHSGRYEGHLTVPGSADREDFAGILELLAILERLVLPDEDEDV